MLIVTLGDSVTRGVRDGVDEAQIYASRLEVALRAAGRDARVVASGVPAENTDGALQRLPQVLALHPDFVTVMYGLNDASIDAGSEVPRVPVERYAANLTSIVKRLRAAHIQPLLMTPNSMGAFGITRELYADRPPYSTHGDINFVLVDYVAAAQRVGASTGVPVLDIFGAFGALADAERGLQGYLTDGMHPNPAGHQVIADCLAGYFISLP